MTKNREKCLAVTLLTVILGVLHFFFGRTILSAILFLVEIGLFWIIGAGIVVIFVLSLIATLCDSDLLDKAEKLIIDEEDCDDCDDEDCEYHIEIRCKNKKKECCCNSEDDECECEVDDNDESEVVEEVEVESEEDELPDSETKEE